MVKCLLQHPSIDPNKRDSSGRTALLHAVTRRNTDIVKSLLNHPSIDINIPDSKGNTAWICFVTENIKDPEHEIIQLFLDNKSVDVNKIDGQSGHTGLMHMILKNAEVENIKLLLNRIDIDVNVVTANNFATAGMTALMIAAKYGRVEALKALLQVSSRNISTLCNIIYQSWVLMILLLCTYLHLPHYTAKGIPVLHIIISIECLIN